MKKLYILLYSFLLFIISSFFRYFTSLTEITGNTVFNIANVFLVIYLW